MKVYEIFVCRTCGERYDLEEEAKACCPKGIYSFVTTIYPGKRKSR